MIDYVDTFTKIIMLSYSFSYYHLVYWSMNRMEYYICEYYSIFKKPLMYCLFVIIIFMINRNGRFLYKHFPIQLYYVICMFIIIIVGNSPRFVILGLSLSFFLSEYWEIPHYLYRLFYTSEYIGLQNGMKIALIIGFISKILTVVYVIRELKMLKMNHIRFIKIMIAYMVIYVPTVFYIIINLVDMHRWDMIGISNWIFRISTYLVFFIYIIHEQYLNTGKLPISFGVNGSN